jgi:hypothetical protein
MKEDPVLPTPRRLGAVPWTGPDGTCIVIRGGGSVGKNSANRAFSSAKSAMSATSTVVLTTKSGWLPAA